jgi:hypothetical protein
MGRRMRKTVGGAGCRIRRCRRGRRRSWRPGRGRGRCPELLVVTNGSNRCGIRSSGTPGPLSRTQTSSGSATRLRQCPAHGQRTPGRKAVESTISPSLACSPMASAAFFTRLRKTWTSWSRLPKTGGSEGSYSSTKRMCRAKPDCDEPLHVLEHDVDVDRLALDRPLVGEDLHRGRPASRSGRPRRRSAASASGPRRRPTARGAAPRRGCRTAGS